MVTGPQNEVEDEIGAGSFVWRTPPKAYVQNLPANKGASVGKTAHAGANTAFVR